MGGIGALANIGLTIAVFLLGVYGLLTDIFHGHWGWTLINVVTGGFTAVIRGFGFYFGYIGY
ncbi:hypothetical protein CTA21_24520 [Salmonella enterica]|nr:hypothetical protein [Salmonella enterica]